MLLGSDYSFFIRMKNVYSVLYLNKFIELIIQLICMYLLLVFLPLIGSCCAGLFGRFLGPLGSSCMTVFCLVSTFCLSLFAFYEVALLNCCVYVKLGP